MEHVIIKDKKYSLETLKLLTGQEEMVIKKIPNNVLVIAEAVDGPDKLPYLLETIKSLKIDDMDKFRYE
jgi:hypothetical protein